VDWTLQLLRQHYLRQPNALDFAALAKELNVSRCRAAAIQITTVIAAPR